MSVQVGCVAGLSCRGRNGTDGSRQHMQRNEFTNDPRLRLLRAGPEALDDAELLAVIVHHGLKSSAAMALGQALMNRFNGLNGIGRAGVWALSSAC